MNSRCGAPCSNTHFSTLGPAGEAIVYSLYSWKREKSRGGKRNTKISQQMMDPKLALCICWFWSKTVRSSVWVTAVISSDFIQFAETFLSSLHVDCCLALSLCGILPYSNNVVSAVPRNWVAANERGREWNKDKKEKDEMRFWAEALSARSAWLSSMPMMSRTW